ncbi:hypothetical protein KKH56_00685 [bacterium]|nr:hypothetical protein [bacterium]
MSFQRAVVVGSCLRNGLSPRVWKDPERVSDLLLEETSGNLHLAKEGCDLRLADLVQKELQHIASNEENQGHCLCCVKIMGIEVLGMDQVIEGLKGHCPKRVILGPKKW